MRLKRTRLSIALTALTALAIVPGCGGDDDDSAATPTGAPTQSIATTNAPAESTPTTDAPAESAPTTGAPAEPPATTNAPPESTEGTTAPASGEPIRVAIYGSPQNIAAQEIAANAAIAVVNEQGGINGRPIELVTCDNENDPNKSTECARRFADDPSIIATVGIVSNFGGDTNPIFEQADLAGIGTAPVTAGDYASPIVFPTSISSLGNIAMAALLYDQLDAQRVGLLLVDVPGSVALEGLVTEHVMSPRGTQVAATGIVPLTAADLTPQAAALADTDGLALFVGQDLAIRFIQAARQQGYAGPIVQPALAASIVEESLAGFTEDLYITSVYNWNSPGWERMLSEIEATGEEMTIPDAQGHAWLSVQLFAHVARTLETVDRPSIVAAMNELSEFDTEGMTASPLDFTVEGEALGGNAPNIRPELQYVFGYQYQDGEFVRISDEPQPVFAAPGE